MQTLAKALLKEGISTCEKRSQTCPEKTFSGRGTKARKMPALRSGEPTYRIKNTSSCSEAMICTKPGMAKRPNLDSKVEMRGMSGVW